ncbi:MAG TPA: diacylglycerol kinase family protein, partial [Chryseolinea sp.]|nr:diacylglycerol kinase family protein [Chryseolinea sp.]
MTFIKVFHNPTAGDAEHTKEKLVEKIINAGFECSYSSTKKGINEKRIPAKTDIIAVAGGDGTVRKLAEYFCNENILTKRPPIGLLPAGTANNISKTLGIKGTPEEIIQSWKEQKTQNFDMGKVHGLKENHFFLEGFGFGVFPRLIKKMRERKSKTNDPEHELQVALRTLHEIVENYKPKECRLVIDDVEYNGKFLLVEVMNIRSIGPNLNISPMGDAGDGEFDVILIQEDKREELAEYVLERLKNG